jgi:hypothetical protein
MMVVEVAGRLGDGGADGDPEQLTACQDDAAAGRCAQAMAGYVQWLAPRIEAIHRSMHC